MISFSRMALIGMAALGLGPPALAQRMTGLDLGPRGGGPPRSGVAPRGDDPSRRDDRPARLNERWAEHLFKTAKLTEVPAVDPSRPPDATDRAALALLRKPGRALVATVAEPYGFAGVRVVSVAIRDEGDVPPDVPGDPELTAWGRRVVAAYRAIPVEVHWGIGLAQRYGKMLLDARDPKAVLMNFIISDLSITSLGLPPDESAGIALASCSAFALDLGLSVFGGATTGGLSAALTLPGLLYGGVQCVDSLDLLRIALAREQAKKDHPPAPESTDDGSDGPDHADAIPAREPSPTSKPPAAPSKPISKPTPGPKPDKRPPGIEKKDHSIKPEKRDPPTPFGGGARHVT